jgi:hypothetical protein
MGNTNDRQPWNVCLYINIKCTFHIHLNGFINFKYILHVKGKISFLCNIHNVSRINIYKCLMMDSL